MSEKKQFDVSKLTDFEIALLLIDRDSAQYRKERIDEVLNQIGAAKGYEDAKKSESATAPKKEPIATVPETTFTILKWDPQQGAKIGSYEVAYKANNVEDKWTSAFNILRQSNSTITGTMGKATNFPTGCMVRTKSTDRKGRRTHDKRAT